MELRLNLFGRFRLTRDQQPIALPTRKSESLFAFLALHPGPHSRARLAAMFWPDAEPAAARASLRSALSSLRQKLDAEVFEFDREVVGIRQGFPLQIDVEEFERHAVESGGKDPVAFATRALELYDGELLTDHTDEWTVLARERLRESHRELLLLMAREMRSKGDYSEAIRFALRALEGDPADERAHQHLMFCYAAQGDRRAAVRQWESCRRALRDELDVAPSAETEELREWIEQSAPQVSSVEAAVTNLPMPTTRYIERPAEERAIKTALEGDRLLTLTGAAGAGKTRLGVRVATEMLGSFRDGVWFVDLATASSADQLLGAVARILGVKESPGRAAEESLAAFIRPRQMLIVLDNCERVVLECAALLDRLLHQCPALTVLATSRVAFDLDVEQRFSVPVLPVPEAGMEDIEVDTVESVRLFVDRARSADPGFRIAPANRQSVAEICRRLAGLPLAIELAAANVATLSPAQIAERFAKGFEEPRPGELQREDSDDALRAALDGSYDLLTAKHQGLFQRLSVFAGSWTMAAAQSVCVGRGLDEDEIPDLLLRLRDVSLVETLPRGGETRFRMLRPILQYAARLLDESGAGGETTARHVQHYAKLAHAPQAHLGYFLADADTDRWKLLIDLDYANIRAAAIACLSDPELTQRFGASMLAALCDLHWYWFTQGRFAEGAAWVGQLLEEDIDPGDELRTRGQLVAGFLSCWQGDFAAASGPLSEAREVFRRREDASGAAFATHGLAYATLGSGDPVTGRTLFEECIAIARQAEDAWLAAFALHFAAVAAAYLGDIEQAAGMFEQCRVDLRSCGGHRQGEAFALFHLARIARLEGRFADSANSLVECLDLFCQSADRRGIGFALASAAVLATALGQHERAAALAAAVASLQQELGMFMEAPLQAEFEAALAAGNITPAGSDAAEGTAAMQPPATGKLLDEAIAVARSVHPEA